MSLEKYTFPNSSFFQHEKIPLSMRLFGSRRAGGFRILGVQSDKTAKKKRNCRKNVFHSKKSMQKTAPLRCGQRSKRCRLSICFVWRWAEALPGLFQKRCKPRISAGPAPPAKPCQPAPPAFSSRAASEYTVRPLYPVTVSACSREDRTLSSTVSTTARNKRSIRSSWSMAMGSTAASE